MKSYPWQKEMIQSLRPVELNDTAKMILDKRYRWRAADGSFEENYEELFWRIAWNVAQAERNYDEDTIYWAEKFYNMMAQMKFLPNSPTIMNAGRTKASLSACFVLPIGDSMEEIYDNVKKNALVQKDGGGVGTDFTPLRPKGSYVASTGGLASGPVSFMKVINYSTDSIKQGGKRRGANMGILSVHHQDILEFIDCKAVLAEENVKLFSDFAKALIRQRNNPKDEEILKQVERLCDWQGNAFDGYNDVIDDILKKAEPILKAELENYIRTLLDTQFKNFNISVAVTDEFMAALRDNTDYNLYDNYYSKDRKVIGTLSAAKVWNKLVYNAWKNGEPGVVFIDTVNRHNPLKDVCGPITSTNPCGEQPLYPSESCNLGSINVSKFVDPDTGEIDYDGLGECAELAVRFLDDIIDLNCFPLEEITWKTLENRKIGLGIMGLADALILAGIPYGSIKGRDTAKAIIRTVMSHAEKASMELAKDRGTFPNASLLKDTIYAKRRNLSLTTIAPTGTISMIAGCSSGIEPLFALGYTKTVLNGTPIPMVSDAVVTFLKRKGIYSEELMKKIAETGVLPDDVDGLDEYSRKVLAVAGEISPEDHVLMQAAIQRFVESSISKTINFPNSATVEDVDRVYRLAYEQGCKGITIYRDGSRNAQVLTIGQSNGSVSEESTFPAEKVDGVAKKADNQGYIEPRQRVDVTTGTNERIKIGCGKCYVQIFEDSQGICEVFTTVGKNGGCASAMLQGLSIVLSHALRAGMNPETLAKSLRGIRCPNPCLVPGGQILSCPDAIGVAMERYIKRMKDRINQPVNEELLKHASQANLIGMENFVEATPSVIGKASDPLVYYCGTCSECGSAMVSGGGCPVCPVCGFSKCS